MNLLSRLVIPAPVQAGWALVRPLLPYIAGALAILGAYLWAHHRGAEAQKAKDAPVIAKLQSDLATSRANETTLKSTIAAQNAAVDALKAEGDRRASVAKSALSEAQRANAPLSKQSDDLRASAAKVRHPDEPCTISAKLRSADL